MATHHSEKLLATSPGNRTPSEELATSKPETLRPQTESASPNDLQKLDSQVVKQTEDLDEVLKHLPPDERDVIKGQLDIPEVKVNYFTLYRFATKMDLLVIVVSTLCAIAGGAALPLMTVCVLALSDLATLRQAWCGYENEVGARLTDNAARLSSES